MGSHPCLVRGEWELLQIPPGWPVTEQTESCLFSGSVTEEHIAKSTSRAKARENDFAFFRLLSRMNERDANLLGD